MGLGNYIVVDVQTFLQAFLNMSLRSACFIDEAFFLVKIKTLVCCPQSAGLSEFSA